MFYNTKTILGVVVVGLSSVAAQAMHPDFRLLFEEDSPIEQPQRPREHVRPIVKAAAISSVSRSSATSTIPTQTSATSTPLSTTPVVSSTLELSATRDFYYESPCSSRSSRSLSPDIDPVFKMSPKKYDETFNGPGTYSDFFSK